MTHRIECHAGPSCALCQAQNAARDAVDNAKRLHRLSQAEARIVDAMGLIGTAISSMTCVALEPYNTIVAQLERATQLLIDSRQQVQQRISAAIPAVKP